MGVQAEGHAVPTTTHVSATTDAASIPADAPRPRVSNCHGTCIPAATDAPRPADAIPADAPRPIPAADAPRPIHGAARSIPATAGSIPDGHEPGSSPGTTGLRPAWVCS